MFLYQPWMRMTLPSSTVGLRTSQIKEQSLPNSLQLVKLVNNSKGGNHRKMDKA